MIKQKGIYWLQEGRVVGDRTERGAGQQWLRGRSWALTESALSTFPFSLPFFFSLPSPLLQEASCVVIYPEFQGLWWVFAWPNSLRMIQGNLKKALSFHPYLGWNRLRGRKSGSQRHFKEAVNPEGLPTPLSFDDNGRSMKHGWFRFLTNSCD